MLLILALIAAQVIFSSFNWGNSYLDWYRISIKNKTVKHWLNLMTYGIVVGAVIYLLWWYFHIHWPLMALIALSAFFNRQITFDIPLNLRRGLSAFYQSKEHRAAMDWIEWRLFGFIGGKELAIIYASLWGVLLTSQFFLK